MANRDNDTENSKSKNSTTLQPIEGLEIRLTQEGDALHLKQWLQEPEILKWYPIKNEFEIDESVKWWIGYSKVKSSLTAVYKGQPCGMATLCLHHFSKIKHQCELSMIVSGEHRNKGIGTLLLNSLIHMAKNRFNLEILHLQVYDTNPAKRLYERFGFQSFGFQRGWIKEDGEFLGRHLMERYL